jgi:hypothetical protein
MSVLFLRSLMFMFRLSVCLSAYDVKSVPKPLYGIVLFCFFPFSRSSRMSPDILTCVKFYITNQMHNINYIIILNI